MFYIFISSNVRMEETGKIKLWNYLLHSTFKGTSFIFYSHAIDNEIHLSNVYSFFWFSCNILSGTLMLKTNLKLRI